MSLRTGIRPVLFVVLLGGGGLAACDPPPVTHTYSIATTGPVVTSVSSFAAEAARIYGDTRGWAHGNRLAFRRVAAGGEFTLWLATPDRMRAFSSGCSATYNCRVGRNVILNEARWRFGSPTGLPLSLADYRALSVNHETGHWLGLQHWSCPARGASAPVMMQQSVFLGGCRANPWPTAAELARVTGGQAGTLNHQLRTPEAVDVG